MSIRADLFVATRPDAPRYEACIHRGEEPPFSEVHASGHITGLEFGTPWVVLEQQPWDPERHTLADLSPEEGGDTWLNEFPGRLTELLAELDDKGAEAALVRWAATEELQCDPRDLRPGLTALTLGASAGQGGLSVGRCMNMLGPSELSLFEGRRFVHRPFDRLRASGSGEPSVLADTPHHTPRGTIVSGLAPAAPCWTSRCLHHLSRAKPNCLSPGRASRDCADAVEPAPRHEPLQSNRIEVLSFAPFSLHQQRKGGRRPGELRRALAKDKQATMRIAPQTQQG